MTNADYIQWLEIMVVGCNDLGGMEIEKAIYQNCLKQARTLWRNLPTQRGIPRFSIGQNVENKATGDKGVIKTTEGVSIQHIHKVKWEDGNITKEISTSLYEV